MADRIEVFLDEIPGETRGGVARNDRFEHLLIEREDDDAQHRLGARSIGRIAGIEPGLGGAFVDLGGDPPFGFLPLKRDHGLRQGQKIEVEVSAEHRERKGPTLRLIGPGEGEPRLLKAGPSVIEQLARLAPGVRPTVGPEAIQAVWDCEEEALGGGDFFASTGVDLAIQRTRALVAIDLDYAPVPGRDARAGRRAANREGLGQAARVLRLKRWGGLVAIDLIGVGHDAKAVTAAAKQAFGSDPEIVFGPLNRFGVLMLALPWRLTPVEEVLNGFEGRPSARTRALDIVRRLKMAMLSDTTVPRFVARCAPEEAALAGPLVARLGPRAHILADPAVAAGRCDIEEN